MGIEEGNTGRVGEGTVEEEQEDEGKGKGEDREQELGWVKGKAGETGYGHSITSCG